MRRTEEQPSLGTLQNLLEKRTSEYNAAVRAHTNAKQQLAKAREAHEAALAAFNNAVEALQSQCRVIV